MQGACLAPSLQLCDIISTIAHPESSSIPQSDPAFCYIFILVIFAPPSSQTRVTDIKTGLYNHLN